MCLCGEHLTDDTLEGVYPGGDAYLGKLQPKYIIPQINSEFCLSVSEITESVYKWTAVFHLRLDESCFVYHG